MSQLSSAKQLLHGKVLRWASWDPKHFVTAAARTLIERSPLVGQAEVFAELNRTETLAELRDLVACTEISLVFWACHTSADMPAVADSIREIATLWPECRRVCYLNCQLAEHAAIFVEAGAQSVVSQLPSLQGSLPSILESAPLFSQGFHPLTTGLVQRLPWA